MQIIKRTSTKQKKTVYKELAVVLKVSTTYCMHRSLPMKNTTVIYQHLEVIVFYFCYTSKFASMQFWRRTTRGGFSSFRCHLQASRWLVVLSLVLRCLWVNLLLKMRRHRVRYTMCGHSHCIPAARFVHVTMSKISWCN